MILISNLLSQLYLHFENLPLLLFFFLWGPVLKLSYSICDMEASQFGSSHISCHHYLPISPLEGYTI